MKERGAEGPGRCAGSRRLVSLWVVMGGLAETLREEA